MARRSAVADQDPEQLKFTNEDGDAWDAAASDMPKPVAESVSEYERARKAANKAKDRVHTAHETALGLMKKHKVAQAPYTDENGVRGWLYIAEIEKLKTRQLKKPKRANPEDNGDDD